MSSNESRNYRKKVHARGLVSFHVVVKETDLWVSADVNLEKETRDLVFDFRHQIEAYISVHPEFATTLASYDKDPYAPPHTGIYRVRISRADAGFSDDMTSPSIRKTALRDYLARQFHFNCTQISKGRRGTMVRKAVVYSLICLICFCSWKCSKKAERGLPKIGIFLSSHGNPGLSQT